MIKSNPRRQSKSQIFAPVSSPCPSWPGRHPPMTTSKKAKIIQRSNFIIANHHHRPPRVQCRPRLTFDRRPFILLRALPNEIPFCPLHSLTFSFKWTMTLSVHSENFPSQEGGKLFFSLGTHPRGQPAIDKRTTFGRLLEPSSEASYQDGLSDLGPPVPCFLRFAVFVGRRLKFPGL